jgi:hypothetical protein
MLPLALAGGSGPAEQLDLDRAERGNWEAPQHSGQASRIIAGLRQWEHCSQY